MWRDERSYTVSTNLTKVAGRHDIRTGFDFIRLRLNHWQPEVSNPRGILNFGGGVTGTPGYAGVGGWNSYAAFVLGQMSSYNKSVQYEELSGRENQYGVVRRRSLAGQREAHAQPRSALRVLPADVAREPRNRAARCSHLHRETWRRRRQPPGPRHQGEQDALRAASRRRVPSQRQHGVPRRLRQNLHAAAVDPSDAGTVPAHDRPQRRRSERVHTVRKHRQRDRTFTGPGSLARQPAAAARRGHDALPIRRTAIAARRSPGTVSSSDGCRSISR